MTSCREFRDCLAAALRESPSARDEAERARLSTLSWHEHLLACDDCRRLLAAEEALEILLASLPEPRLPRALARRVLARLEDARSPSRVEPRVAAALDALLELSRPEPVPADLARNVLAAVRARSARSPDIQTQDARLERLLELQPAPQPPAHLARKVLAGLARERLTAIPAGASRARLWRWPLAAAAATILAGAFWWAPWREAPIDLVVSPAPSGSQAGAPATSGAPAQPAPLAAQDEQLLADLELLESWDLLREGDVDFLLSSLDPIDEYLLEWSSEEAAAASESVSGEPGKKNG